MRKLFFIFIDSTRSYAFDYGVATKKDREHSLVGVNIVFKIK
jgi:hypothetical protein